MAFWLSIVLMFFLQWCRPIIVFALLHLCCAATLDKKLMQKYVMYSDANTTEVLHAFTESYVNYKDCRCYALTQDKYKLLLLCTTALPQFALRWVCLCSILRLNCWANRTWLLYPGMVLVFFQSSICAIAILLLELLLTELCGDVKCTYCREVARKMLDALTKNKNVQKLLWRVKTMIIYWLCRLWY